MDLPLRVAPGVRLRSSASGLRAVIDDAPRGAGGPGALGVGARPHSAGDAKGGRGARAQQLVDLERRARAAQEAEDLHGLESVEQTLTSLHLDNHHLRRRPESQVSTTLPAKERAMLERKALRAAQPEVSVFKRAARAKAKAQAETEADHFVRTLDVAHAVITQHRAAVVDDQWHALAEHEPRTVIAELEAEFAATESSCTCVDAGWHPDTSRAYVTVVVRYPTLDVVAERGPGASSSGRGMLRRRTPSERNALYLSAIGSFALATVKRVISVAVASDDVHLVVVRTPDAGTGLEPVYVGTLTREDVTLRPLLSDGAPLVLASAVRPTRFEGPAKDLVALDPDPAVLALVARCVEALEDHEIDTVLEGAAD